MLLRGRALERAGKLPGAAAAYQNIFDHDPSNQDVIDRILIVYRKLKEYRKELAVINRVLEAFEMRDHSMQEKWLKEHPRAAGAGKAVLRKLGGSKYSAFGTDPFVNRLQKRKEIVKKRIGIGGVKLKAKDRGSGNRIKKKPAITKARIMTRTGIKAAGKKTDDAAIARAEKQAARKRREAAAKQRRQAGQARKEAAAEKRKAVARQKAEKRAAKKAALEQKSYPSLFVISLRYLVPLEQIDAEMPRHVAFLDKYYKSGHILASGRQVPRNGGIIIARAKDRGAALQMMKEDPFVRKKFASTDIVEFSASRTAKGFQNSP